MSEWKKLKREVYRKDALLKYHGGIINFSPESINSVENGTNLMTSIWKSRKDPAAKSGPTLRCRTTMAVAVISRDR